MKALAKFWQQRKPRERALAVLCIAAVVGAAVDAAVFAPQRARLAKVTREAAAAQQQLGQLQKLAAQHARQGDSATQERLVTLRSRREAAEATIRAAQVDLIDPRQMPQHLATLLSNHTRLRVLSAQSQAPVPFAANEPAAPHSPAAAPTSAPNPAPATAPAATAPAATPAKGAHGPTLYQHGFELTIEGRYLDLIAYLDALERSPRRMYWRELDMKVNADGVPVTRVALFTLSQDSTWLKL